MERAWEYATQLNYKGRKIAIQIAKGAKLANDWTQYHVKSNDDSFEHTMGEKEIQITVKPSLHYSPENDLDNEKRTPEQTIIIQEIWNHIRELPL
jgi:hypothetical protein